MFGKKNNDYDEDYIAPVEEYRDECTDEHGMTYDNYNSEQTEHDEYSETYAKFSHSLRQGEQILWCGKAVKGARLSESGINMISVIFPLAVAGIIILRMIPVLLLGGLTMAVGVLFIVVAVVIIVSSLKKSKCDYVITNERIISHDGRSFYSESLEGIINIKFTASERNVGSVSYQKVFVRANSTNRVKFSAISGINDPAEACRILTDAVAAVRKNNAGNGHR